MVAAREALVDFYTVEGLPQGGTDGGYWDWVSAFGIPFPIANTRVRLGVLPYHDLHHMVTGYATDEAGEGEISGWTLGTGGGPAFGQLYDLGAFALGLVRFPRRTLAAFWRGRQCRNLYRKPAEYWLSMDADEVRRFTGADQPTGPVLALDRLALVREVGMALFLWGTPIAPTLVGLLIVLDLLGRPAEGAGAYSVAKP